MHVTIRDKNMNADNNFIEDEDDHETLIRWVVFHLGNEAYCVEVEQVAEILRINTILPVPGSPDYVLGITNIRGNIVSVIDGRKRLNLQATDYTDRSRMIVIESENDVVAVVVDDVVDIVDIPESSVNSNPKVKSREDSRYVTGVITDDDNLIIALSAEKFVTENTFDMAAGF